jgi:hypothetical protein
MSTRGRVGSGHTGSSTIQVLNSSFHSLTSTREEEAQPALYEYRHHLGGGSGHLFPNVNTRGRVGSGHTGSNIIQVLNSLSHSLTSTQGVALSHPQPALYEYLHHLGGLLAGRITSLKPSREGSKFARVLFRVLKLGVEQA